MAGGFDDSVCGDWVAGKWSQCSSFVCPERIGEHLDPHSGS